MKAFFAHSRIMAQLSHNFYIKKNPLYINPLTSL
jgi:hypothetical protein